MKQRLIGIDVARALAVIGMIIVNFKIVLAPQDEGWLGFLAKLLEGKAAATFVVLAGLGIAFMTNSALENQDIEKMAKAQKRIIKRALALFIIGLSYMPIWPADILHFYGIYMLFTLFFLRAKTSYIFIAAVSLILIYPLMLMIWDYETGWDFIALDYIDFWTVQGFIRNLFYNGFHPVFPWTAFMLMGLWYGRQELNDKRFLKKSLFINLACFVFIQILSYGLIAFFSQGEESNSESLGIFLGTSPLPPLPLYMFNGISFAIATISACILLAERFKNNSIVQALYKTGQLALTFYVAHVIIGMGLGMEIIPQNEGNVYSLGAFIYTILFSLACLVFAIIWLRYKSSGPLEWFLRKITG